MARTDPTRQTTIWSQQREAEAERDGLSKAEIQRQDNAQLAPELDPDRPLAGWSSGAEKGDKAFYRAYARVNSPSYPYEPGYEREADRELELGM